MDSSRREGGELLLRRLAEQCTDHMPTPRRWGTASNLPPRVTLWPLSPSSMVTGAWVCSGERIWPWLPHQEQVLPAKLPEEQQIRIAQRISLIQHLPKGVYDCGRDGAEDKIQKCVTCWMDFVRRDPIGSLPIMHLYHMDCKDERLMIDTMCPYCRWPGNAVQLLS